MPDELVPAERKPLAPLGPPARIKHEVDLNLEQVSLEDLARFLDQALQGARSPDGYVFWDDGSHTRLNSEDFPFGEKILTIVQVEKIRFVVGDASFDDGSSISIQFSKGMQKLSSSATTENTEAQRRVYAIRNDALTGGARLDTRRQDRLKVRIRYSFSLMIVNLGATVSLIAATFMVPSYHTYPAWWAGIAVWLATLIGEIVWGRKNRQFTVPSLDPVVLKYPEVQPGLTLENWGSIGSIAAAVIGVVTIILMLVS